MANNPAHPFDSPIKVSHQGGWEPNQWYHETSNEDQPSVYEESEIIDKTNKVKRTKIVDKDLEQAIKNDLKTKGFK